MWARSEDVWELGCVRECEEWRWSESEYECQRVQRSVYERCEGCGVGVSRKCKVCLHTLQSIFECLAKWPMAEQPDGVTSLLILLLTITSHILSGIAMMSHHLTTVLNWLYRV